MAKEWTAGYQVLDCWRTGKKRAPGTIGRGRVRPCAKTVTRGCSSGHVVERLIN